MTGYTTLVANGVEAGHNVTFDEIVASGDLTFAVKDITSSNNNDSFFTYKASELSGDDDSVTLELGNITSTQEQEVSINDPATDAGLETLNIRSTSNNIPVIKLVDDALTAETVNISGEGDLDLTGAALATAETIDMSAASGDVKASFGSNDQTVTGGSGDDTFVFGENLDKNDVVDGGGGRNTLSVDHSDAKEANSLDTTGVTNFDVLSVAGDLAGETFDLERFGVTDITFEGTADNAAKVENMTDGGTVRLEDGAGDTSDLDINVAGADFGGTQSLTVELADSDTSNEEFAFDTAGVEELSIVIDSDLDLNGNDIDIDLANGQLETLTLSGTGADTSDVLDLTEGGALGSEVSTVDASELGHDLKVDLNTSANEAVEVTGGIGDDTINGTDLDDTIVGGAGNDTLDGGLGADTLTGGDGSDDFAFVDVADAATSVDAGNVITDFSLEDSDQIGGFDEVDLEQLTTNNLVEIDNTNENVADDNVKTDSVSGAFDAVNLNSATNMLLLDGDFADSSEVETALELGGDLQMTVNSEFADDDGFMAMYDDGTDSYVGLVTTDSTVSDDNSIASGDANFTELVKLTGVSDVTDFTDGDFLSFVDTA